MLKIRASKVGCIMTGQVSLTDNQKATLQGYYDRDKPLTDRMKEDLAYLENKRDNPELPTTVTNYLHELWIQQKYGREKIIESKFLEKGIGVEEDAITLLSKVDKTFYVKNEEFFTDDYFTGTPDVLQDKVIDVKSSWDIFTFDKARREEINSDYEWQLQTYMHLTGLEKAELVYCLVNTPEEIIEREINNLFWKGFSKGTDAFSKREHQIRMNSNFDDIPESERIHKIELTYKTEMITQAQERIELCRKYYDRL